MLLVVRIVSFTSEIPTDYLIVFKPMVNSRSVPNQSYFGLTIGFGVRSCWLPVWFVWCECSLSEYGNGVACEIDFEDLLLISASSKTSAYGGGPSSLNARLNR